MRELRPNPARIHHLALLIGALPLLLAGCSQSCDEVAPPQHCEHPLMHGKTLLDDGGKPVVDNEGCPVFAECPARPANAGNLQLDNGGKPIVDNDGCPVYAQCAPKPADAGGVKVDSGGKPIVDNSGCVVYSKCTIIAGATPKLDGDGNPMFSALGCPLYEAL